MFKLSRMNMFTYLRYWRVLDMNIMKFQIGQSHDMNVDIIRTTGLIMVIVVIDSLPQAL